MLRVLGFRAWVSGFLGPGVSRGRRLEPVFRHRNVGPGMQHSQKNQEMAEHGGEQPETWQCRSLNRWYHSPLALTTFTAHMFTVYKRVRRACVTWWDAQGLMMVPGGL